MPTTYFVTEFIGDYPLEHSETWNMAFENLKKAKSVARSAFRKSKRSHQKDYHVAVTNRDGHTFLVVRR